MHNFIALAQKLTELWHPIKNFHFLRSGLPFENYKRYEKTEVTFSLAYDVRKPHKKFQTSSFINGGVLEYMV